MSRLSGLILGAGLIVGAYATGSAAFTPVGIAPALGTEKQSLVVQARAMTERQKCKALNRCRSKYTACFEKLEKQHRLAEKDQVCVPPYQKCINASFSGLEFFFQRWITPGYIDCSKYPG